MHKRILKATLPHLNWMTKLLLVIAIIVMSATGAFMIRLKKGPLDLDFAKERIEQALSDKEKGYAVKIGKANLVWPEVAAPLLVSLEKFEITHGENLALVINDFSFSLSGLGILKGKIIPSQIIINSPSFKIFKKDGSFNNFWQADNETSVEMHGPIKPKDIRENMRGLLEKVTDPKNREIKTLAALKKIKIKDAAIYGANVEKLAVLNFVLEKHNLGLAGDLEIVYPEKQGKVAHFKSDVLYRHEQKDLTFTANLKDLHTSHITPFLKDADIITKQDLFFNGDLKTAFDKNLNLQLATIDIFMPEGEFVVPDVYEAPIPLKDVIFNAQLNRAEKVLDIKKFQANVGNIPIEAKALGHFKEGKLIAPLELKIADLPLDNIPPVFPKSHLDSPAGEWLMQKLSKGKLYDIVLNTDFKVLRDAETKSRDIEMTNTKVTFKGEGLTVKYHETLKPVTNVTAEGVYEDDSLTIKSSSSKVGALTGKDVTVKITNLSVSGGGLADINVNANGPLKSALDYVSDEPIGLSDELGFDIKTVEGNVDFNVQLNFPTLKNLPKEQVKVNLQGKANDILLPGVVQGLPLTGGPYDLAFKDGAITLKGKGKLAGRDIDLNWLQYLDSTGRDFESKIKAKITADEGLRQSFGIGLTDYISGPLPVDVTYVDHGVKATLDVVGDLAPATLHIDPFGYKKQAGVTGILSLKGYLEGESIKEVDNLKIDTTNFSISGGRLIFRKLKDGSSDIAQGKIKNVKLGQTQGAVDFEISNNNLLKVILNAPVVDISPFISSDKKRKKSAPAEDDRPMQISVKANKMLGKNGESFNMAKLYLELNKAGDPTRIEMDASVGVGNMSVRFKPDANGVRNFRMESDNAGYTLKVFGLYDKMRGGDMFIVGQPKTGANVDDLFGRAQINNFTIVKAPALAKLISAMSLQGVGKLINNEGVSFKKLQSDFEWKFRDDGNLLVMKEGRTSGNQLGLTFEGLVNMGTDSTDISGTIIPLSDVNKVIGSIPIIGDILTGGDALFAATYSMKGPSGDPRVAINPLSVLAPGFIRKILFEGDVDAKVKREENKK